MKLRYVAGAVSAAAVCAALSASSSACAAPPPVTAFSRLAEVQSVAISPDGQAVAMIMGSAERRLLSISIVDQPNAKIMELGSLHASYVRWAGDGYFLVHVTSYEKPAWVDHAYNFSRDMIFSREGQVKGTLLSNSPESQFLASGPSVLRITQGDKPYAVVRGLDSNHPETVDNNTRIKVSHALTRSAIFKVDVSTGKGSKTLNDDADDWAFDGKGEARAKLVEASGRVVLSARGRDQALWKVLATAKSGLVIIGYSDPENAVYWTQEDGAGGAERLRKTSFPGGETTLVPDAPLGANVTADPYTGQPLELDGLDGKTMWLDPGMDKAHAALSRAFKGKSVDFISWSRDRSRFVVRVSSGNSPATWYLFDPAQKNVSLLGDEYPELKDAALGTKTSFTYKAADGLSIPAYLHMPPGGRTKNLPLIVLPHGGPASRDNEGFDWWAQFLASRGYAVLQPQFRGSDGFGSELREAGLHEWGGKMQTDLVDGVKYLADQGTIDPKRVCIMGASYGGYAALQGMAAHGDVYRCGVSVNGMADLAKSVVQEGERFSHGDENESETWRAAQLEYFGQGRDDIAAASPALHADKVTGPVLLIYSTQDTTVFPEQSKEMAQRLQSAGRPATVVELPGDDHQLRNSASRTQMLTAVDAFLAKNLPANP